MQRPPMHGQPREIAVVSALFAIVAAEIVATYWRVPARELYHVRGGGASLAFGRVLVFLDFPFALAAIAALAVVFRTLPWRERPAALVAMLLCAVTAWPGVVDQANLAAKWINVVPAVGVALAAVLILRARVPEAPRLVRGDRVRVALAAVIVLLAAPWIAADNGEYLDGVPVLGRLFQTGKIVTQPGDPHVHHAVHHGHHHGMDGLLLALTALLLSRLLPVARSRLAAAYLALMLSYGLANIANDDWVEQITERGWTRHVLPNMLQPDLNWGWAVVLAAAAGIYALWFRPSSSAYSRAGMPFVSTSRS